MPDIFTVKDLSDSIPHQRKEPEKPKKEENNGQAK